MQGKLRGKTENQQHAQKEKATKLEGFTFEENSIKETPHPHIKAVSSGFYCLQSTMVITLELLFVIASAGFYAIKINSTVESGSYTEIVGVSKRSTYFCKSFILTCVVHTACI